MYIMMTSMILDRLRDENRPKPLQQLSSAPKRSPGCPDKQTALKGQVQAGCLDLTGTQCLLLARSCVLCRCAVPCQEELGLFGPPDTTMLAGEATWASCITGTVAAARSPSPWLDKRASIRSCSQLISALKAASRPLPAELGGECVIGWALQLACRAAMAGPRLHAQATGGRPAKFELLDGRARRKSQMLSLQSTGVCGFLVVALITCLHAHSANTATLTSM
jgi:hypothetical protein